MPQLVGSVDAMSVAEIQPGFVHRSHMFHVNPSHISHVQKCTGSQPAPGLMGQRSEEQQQIHEQAACGHIRTDIPNIQNNLGFFDVGVSNQRCASLCSGISLEVALVEHPKLAFSKKSIDFHQCPVLPVIPKSENTHVYHV